MSIKFPTITLSPGDVDFLREAYEFIGEILDVVEDNDDEDCND